MNINPLWFMCIVVRSLLGVIVWVQPVTKPVTVNFLSALLLFMGIGFFYKAITGSNDEVQASKVFWHNVRAVHGVLYAAAAAFLFSGYPRAASAFIYTDLVFSIFYRITTDQ